DGGWCQASAGARATDHQEAASRGSHLVPRVAPKLLKKIKAIAMDVDGVLTDGGVWWGPNGEEWKRFHFADIMGLSRARRAGIKLALISGEDSPLIDRLAAKMQISDVEKSCKDKARALQKLADLHHLAL